MNLKTRICCLALTALAVSAVVAATPAPASAETPPSQAADMTDGWPHKDTPEAAIYRGSIVFANYCALCHGVAADGKGRAARLYNPRPANLVMSDKNDTYKELIIRRGGEAMGRSKFMPPWGMELTDEQISDVVKYLRSINQYKAE